MSEREGERGGERERECVTSTLVIHPYIPLHTVHTAVCVLHSTEPWSHTSSKISYQYLEDRIKNVLNHLLPIPQTGGERSKQAKMKNLKPSVIKPNTVNVCAQPWLLTIQRRRGKEGSRGNY